MFYLTSARPRERSLFGIEPANANRQHPRDFSAESGEKRDTAAGTVNL